MRAACWHGTEKIGIERVPDPVLLAPGDAIVKVTAATICGSDLHIYDGFIPSMMRGDIIGHEFMGEVVEVGPDVRNVHRGDRVVVTSTISCGACDPCDRGHFSLCDNGNPNAAFAERVLGYSIGGIFGYSHLMGGYAGAFAEYVRVPFAEVGCIVVPPELPDESLLFLSDAVPTGFMGADLAGIDLGDVVAVWGCGAVGQFAIRFASLMGASKVIAIDRFPERLRLAKEQSGAIPLDYTSVDLIAELKELTGGRGPDACIDAVGMEAHGVGPGNLYDRAKTGLGLESDRIGVVRQMIHACRKGGTVVIMGVYIGMADSFPLGIAMNKGLTFRMGQMHGQLYGRRALDHVLNGELDPSFVATHRMSLDEIGPAFEMFKHKSDECMRIVLTPGAT
jgi:threonine dehydrogenase-like Zn-dependent dehydrogenase